MLCDALSDAMGLARIRLQSIVASLRRKTSILFQIKQNDIGAPSLGGFVLLCRYTVAIHIDQESLLGPALALVLTQLSQGSHLTSDVFTSRVSSPVCGTVFRRPLTSPAIVVPAL